MKVAISSEEKKKYELDRSHLVAIMDSVDDAIYSIDVESRVLNWNKGAEKIFGYSKSEIIGKNILDEIVPASKREEVKHVQDLIRQGKRIPPYETVRIHKDKRRIYVEFSLSLIRDKKNKIVGVSVIGRDISKRKKLEEERNTYLKELNQLINMAPIGIGFMDQDYHFLRVNKMLSLMDGISVEKHVGKPLWDIFSKTFSQYLTKKIELLYPKREPYNFELEAVLNKNTKEKRWWLVTFYPTGFSKDKYGIGILLQDITDQKLLEKRKDDFISMASHELKTPLTTIKAFTQILQNTTDSEQRKKEEYLVRIESQVGKLTKIINDLLDISKIRTGSFFMIKENFAFDLLVEETISNYRYMQNIPHKISVSGRTNQEIHADRNMIQQVVTNLINNAIRYSPGRKKINIYLSSNGKYVTFSVKDYGVGISPADQKRIFQSFYRVINAQEHEYPGLGIGLYISQEIVSQHKGKIDVISSLGRGSTFSVSLPLKNHII